jgi:beta-glucosidase
MKPSPDSPHHSRRSFLKLAGTTAAALTAGALPLRSAVREKGDDGRGRDSFPRGFQWGTATAAYQIEGGVRTDGRGPSIWDTFSHTPGKVLGGETGDEACQFLSRYTDDVKLLADLGVKHFRFSISWSRVIPEGRGTVNERGLDFYKRLADTLLGQGIRPHATLYHWDLPQGLQDRYAGWQSREVVDDFAAYASVVAAGLGDRVRDWMTLNEIGTFTHIGYGVGKPGDHAPGIALADARARNQVVHHALLAHGAACQAIRASSPEKPMVSIAECYTAHVPVTETPRDIVAAERAFVRESPNGGLIIPILTGAYDKGWMEDHKDSLPEIAEGDMKLIAQPLDALGFNCYTGVYVRASEGPKGYEVLPYFPGYPKANMPWLNILPEAIYWGIRLVGEAAGKKELPIFISENGCADGGLPDAGGRVLDTDRIMYYRSYLGRVHRAVSEGYPVSGFFPWSLLDNFEWACGYSKRFGLVRVDYETQRRIPKLSFDWYREVIRNNRVV